MNENKGFVRLIIIIIIGLVVLKFFFSFDIIEFLESSGTKPFLTKAWDITTSIFAYIFKVIKYAWENGKNLVLEAIEIARNIF